MDRFKGLVDVCGGKMTLPEVTKEIVHYMLTKKPERLIVDIQRKPDGYRAFLWMSEKDFKK